MKTSLTSRIVGVAAAVLVTFGAVKTMADYAYPAAPAVLLASASR